MPIQGMEIDPTRDAALADGLTGAAERLLDQHLDVAKTWYPHEFMDFDVAQSFDPDVAWKPEDFPMPDGLRSALFVNLLTEDNLPYYTDLILGDFDRNHPFAEWGRRWTAEEGRHSEVIRGWVHISRALDPRELEDARMDQVSGGVVPETDTFAELVAYTSFQELATQVAHRGAGAMLRQLDRADHPDRDKPVDHGKMGNRILGIVAGDEGRHYRFYSGLAAEALAIDPNTMMIALRNQLQDFQMPGTGIRDFGMHRQAIAKAGIYDANKYLNNVVVPVLDKLQIDSVEGLDSDGEAARAAIHRRVRGLGIAVRRSTRVAANT